MMIELYDRSFNIFLAAIILITFSFIASPYTHGEYLEEESGPPAIPDWYTGVLSLDGRPAPAGVTIVTTIDNEFTGNFTSDQPGYYGIPDEDELKIETTQNNIGEQIDFYLKDHEEELVEVDHTEPPDIRFESGTVDERDLHFGYVNLGDSLPSVDDWDINEFESHSVEVSTSITYNEYSSGSITFLYREEGERRWNDTGYESISESSYSTTISGLEGSTTYEVVPYIEVDPRDEEVAKGSTGPVKEFTTEPSEPPTVTTEEASDITESSAELQASIDYGTKDSLEVGYYYREKGMQWQNTSFETTTSTTHSKIIEGLDTDTEYEYYASIRSEHYEDEGDVKEFITMSAPFSVTTEEATDITENSAELHASIDGDVEENNVFIEYHYRESGGEWKITSPERVTSDTHSKTIEDLDPDTDYEYKANITFGEGEDEGEIKEFTTEESSSFEPNYIIIISIAIALVIFAVILKWKNSNLAKTEEDQDSR